MIVTFKDVSFEFKANANKKGKEGMDAVICLVYVAKRGSGFFLSIRSL